MAITPIIRALPTWPAAHGVEFAGKTVLILGTGGTHNTVTAVCQDGGAKQVLTASRTGKGGALTYEKAQQHPEIKIIINTTPAGMYPNVGQCLLDSHAFPELEAVLDCVYNPSGPNFCSVPRTRRARLLWVRDAGGAGCVCRRALYRQKSCRKLSSPTATASCGEIERRHYRDAGLRQIHPRPPAGKAPGQNLVDLDEEIVKADGRSIPDIFAAEGEEGFRAKEAAKIARFGKEKGLVLSCGGGAVKRAENVRALRQNGVVLFIDRPVEALAVGGAPAFFQRWKHCARWKPSAVRCTLQRRCRHF